MREIRLEPIDMRHLDDVRGLRSIHVKQGRRSDAGLWSRLPTDPHP